VPLFADADPIVCRGPGAPFVIRIMPSKKVCGRMIEGSCHCGAVRWSFDGIPDSATACNCTVCRRYGVLWAYDYEDERIRVSGPARVYVRGPALGFHFCADCGCVAYWRALVPGEDGRRRIAVNLRLAEPEAVDAIVVDHFDGLVSLRRTLRRGHVVLGHPLNPCSAACLRAIPADVLFPFTASGTP
jgi:hypothetical protein